MWRKLRCEWMLSTNHFQNYPRRTSANILCKLNRWGLCLFVWTKQLQENWFFKNVLYPNNCLKEHHEQVISQAFNLFKCTITKQLILIYVVFFFVLSILFNCIWNFLSTRSKFPVRKIFKCILDQVIYKMWSLSGFSTCW